MWLILIILVALVVYLVMQRRRETPTRGLSSNETLQETPMEILKRRYARGDISEEEFNKMKKDLEG